MDELFKIIERGEAMAKQYGIRFSRQTALMDIHFADKQYPLDLAALLAADDFNFCHDFFGIAANMNRKTAKLENCFVPRFARADLDHADEMARKMKTEGHDA